MNKKRIISIILSVLLVVVLMLPATNADAADGISANLVTLINVQSNKLVEYLKLNASKGEPHILIENFMKDNKFPLPGTLNNNLVKLSETNNIYVLKSVDLGNGCYLTFLSNGVFYLDELKEKQLKYPYPSNLSAVNVTNNYSSSTSQIHYKFASNDRYAYNIFGWPLFRIHIESNFGYNGTKAWYAGGLVGYYSRYISGGIWQVSNWQVGTTVINGGEYCRAYARGNFHFGIEYQGIGWIFQDVYEDVRVSVTRNGTVYRN